MSRLKRIGVLAGVVLLVGLLAVGAFSQSPGSPPPATAVAPANASPQTVHYHYHYHFHYHYAPQQASLMYPSTYANPYNGGAVNAQYPLPPTSYAPSAMNPYPPGYVPGGYAPPGFQSIGPNAPTAQGVIHVFLPTKDAIVFLNGQKMRGTGKDRKLTTPVLPSNQEFQYWVTATFNQNGESVTQYRKAIVGAGEYTVVDFNRPPEENPIRLPAGPVSPNSIAPAQ